MLWLSQLLPFGRKWPKIFVYPVPAELYLQDGNGFVFELNTCPLQGIYDSEIIIPRLLPPQKEDEADFFYLPAMPACFYHRCLVDKSPGECQGRTVEYMERIITWVDDNYGVYLRERGRTILTLTLDRAIQFFEISPTLHETLQRMIILQHDGSQVYSPLTGFRPNWDITIPTYRNYSDIAAMQQRLAGKQTQRAILGYFRGTFKPTEPRYGHGYRSKLWSLAQQYPNSFYVREGHSELYWHELRLARWALCPEGWVPWSPRLYDALQVGSMPLILSERWLPPKAIRKFVNERVRLTEMEKLPEILSNMPRAVPAWVALAVRWQIPAQPGDAFYQLMAELADRLSVPDL